MKKNPSLIKITDFWLGPFFIGVFLGLGYGFTHRLLIASSESFDKKAYIKEEEEERFLTPNSQKKESPDLSTHKIMNPDDLIENKVLILEESTKSSEPISSKETLTNNPKNLSNPTQAKRYIETEPEENISPSTKKIDENSLLEKSSQILKLKPSNDSSYLEAELFFKENNINEMLKTLPNPRIPTSSTKIN